jgi:hypothetical protein
MLCLGPDAIWNKRYGLLMESMATWLGFVGRQ